MSLPFKINTYHTLSTSRIIAGSLNFHKCSQMSIIKLLIALCSYALNIAIADEGLKSPTMFPMVQAEPISPATTQQHPHLEPYLGHVLLSSAKVQVVLAGVSLRPNQSHWQPAVLALFNLDAAFGPPTWVKRHAISAIDLSTSAGSNSSASAHQLAVVTGTDADGSGAYAHILYGNKSNSKPTIKVTWHLDAATGRLAYLAESDQGNATGANPMWQLRLRGDGNTLLGPVTGNGKFSGSEYLYRYHDTDVVSVIGFRLLNIKSDSQTIEPAPVQPPLAPPADGVEIDLAIQQSADQTLARVLTLRQCKAIHTFKHQFKIAEDFWAAFNSCHRSQGIAHLEVQGTVGLTPTNLSRPVFLFDREGHAVAYMVIPSHSSRSLFLPVPGEYLLADTRDGRLIEGVAPILLTEDQKYSVNLPPQLRGELKLKLGTINFGPNLLVIEPVNASDLGTNIVFNSSNPEDSLQQLDNQVWLLRSKEASATLTEGSYQISLVNGRVGVICRHRLMIAAGYRSSINCIPHEQIDPTDFGGSFVYANMNPVNSPEMPPQIPFSADLRRAETQALGLDLAGQSIADPAHSTDLDITFLEVKSDQFDAKLRYWPANSQLRDRWNQVQLSPGDDSFTRFRRFLADEGESGWLELVCPNNTLGSDDLKLIIQTTKPAALQFFGCRSGQEHNDLISLWSKLSTQTLPPIVLTAAPINLHDAKSPFLPKMAISTRPSSLGSPVDIWTALQKRTFSLSAGATVQIREVSQPSATDADGHNWDLQLALTVSPYTRVREIVVYSENGVLKRGYPPNDFSHKGLITLRSVPIAQSQWLRVELRGSSVHLIDHPSGQYADSDTGETVLAATNFVPVVNLRAKHERPEVPH